MDIEQRNSCDIINADDNKQLSKKIYSDDVLGTTATNLSNQA